MGADAVGIIIKRASSVKESDLEHRTAQRLITDLTLYDGRKFHVRVMYLWCPGKVAYLMWNGMILASPHEYDAFNQDPKIQITNRSFHQRQQNSDTPKSPAFKDWHSHGSLLNSMREMGQELFDCLENRLRINPPKQHGQQYDLYGLDVLFTAKKECKLLEVNVYWDMYPDPVLLAMAAGAFSLLTRGIRDVDEAAKLDAFAYHRPRESGNHGPMRKLPRAREKRPAPHARA